MAFFLGLCTANNTAEKAENRPNSRGFAEPHELHFDSQHPAEHNQQGETAEQSGHVTQPASMPTRQNPGPQTASQVSGCSVLGCMEGGAVCCMDVALDLCVTGAIRAVTT